MGIAQAGGPVPRIWGVLLIAGGMEVYEHSPWGSLVVAGISTAALTAAAIAMMANTSEDRRPDRAAEVPATVSVVDADAGAPAAPTWHSADAAANPTSWRFVVVDVLSHAVDAAPVSAQRNGPGSLRE